MKLYQIDYTIVSDEDNKICHELKEKEIVYLDGKPTKIRRPLNREYPKAVRHNLSLFPNNFIDAVDLVSDKDRLTELLARFEGIINDTLITERNVLDFIKNNESYFIVGSILKKEYRFGHHALFLFPEFKLPPNYQADYLIVGANSDGYHFVFVEFENPYHHITTLDGSFGTTIRKGIKQCEEWEVWLEENFSHLRLIFESILNKDTSLPREFSVFDKTRIHYVVVAGRRPGFNEKTYRLRRNDLERRNLLVLHYDNLIDYAKEAIGTFTF